MTHPQLGQGCDLLGSYTDLMIRIGFSESQYGLLIAAISGR